MADRYFCEAPIYGDQALLDQAEAHHLLHVMRARPGDEVVLFDGSGMEFRARIERANRSTVELSVLSREVIDRELRQVVQVGVALPKGDRQKWLVEKLTELGVARLTPLHTRRSVAQPLAGAVERLRRSVVEASKQCGRNRLMKIDAAHPLPEFLASVPPEGLRWFAHPRGLPLAAEIDRLRSSSPADIQHMAIAIGPEGGFTDEEASLATMSGWQPIDLGSRILRIETAAVALAVVAGQLSS